MTKKEELLATEQPQEKEFEYYELSDLEKGQIQALAELVQQARLAQDVIYTNLVQSVAARYELTNRTIDIDMQEVMTKGASNVKLRVSKLKEEEKTDEAFNETPEVPSEEQENTNSQENSEE